MSEGEPKEAELIVVLGAKGGVGTTLVACNLAKQLASTRATALVDLDVGRGGVAGALDLTPERGVHDLLRAADKLDPALLRGCATPVGPGLSVLTQPDDLAQIERAEPARVQALIALAREAWDVVVVDGGVGADPSVLTAALGASRVLLVLEPTIAALREGRRLLALLDGLGVSPGRVGAVVNRSCRRPRLSVAEVVERLALPLLGELRQDEAAARAAEFQGRPVVDVAPGSPLAHDLDALCGRLTQAHPPAAAPLHRWLFGIPRA